jgi:hypothetical protein
MSYLSLNWKTYQVFDMDFRELLLHVSVPDAPRDPKTV